MAEGVGGRQVPEYEVKEFSGKSSRWCWCVFVINEGERIARQLRKMRPYADLVDIIIADGGSDDGSLAPETLRQSGIRTLLTKTGPGRLSAQMRMALAYAVDEGYDGMIVMDGNDKDDPAALPEFVRRLEGGWDHIQGSRFIKDGHHENTPLSRLLAVRLLHAPLMRSFSGFRYTDTTNGFRAYSRRLITDPRVDPFRDVFTTYELHYYLAIRAPELGFRTCEIPVSRVYPAMGRTPTKIGSFSAKFGLLRLLWRAGHHHYDPPPDGPAGEAGLRKRSSRQLSKWSARARRYGGWLLGPLGLLSLLSFAAVVGSRIYVAATAFDCLPLNGCFQMFDPLRRLAAGQLVGRDFQYFYGAGALLIHYPFFSLLGGDLLASETAKLVVQPALFLGVTFVAFLALTRRLGLSTFLTAAAAGLATTHFPSVFMDTHHQLGVRAALPVAIFGLLLWRKGLPRRWRSPDLRSSLIGILPLSLLAATAFTISPEQGAMTVGALLIMLTLWSGNWRHAVRNGSMFAALALLGGAIMLELATLGHATTALRFHLTEARPDQFWYFGAWPGGFHESILGVVTERHGAWGFGGVLLAVLAAFLLRRRTDRRLKAAVTFLLTYGLLSTVSILGYIKKEYFHALSWVLLLVFVTLLLQPTIDWVRENLRREVLEETTLRSKRGLIAVVAVLGLSVLAAHLIFHFCLSAYENTDRAIAIARKADERTSGMTTLGVTLDEAWAEHREALIRYVALPGTGPIGQRAADIWSTYSSIPEAELGIFNPASDYIIHALGPERRAAYAAAFDETRPPVIRTLNNKTPYEYWLTSTHWDMYRLLLANYEFREQDSKGAIWTRRRTPWTRPDDIWHGELPITDGRTFTLPTFPEGRYVLELAVDYAIDNPWNGIPVARDLPRYVIMADVTDGPVRPTYVSFAPYYDRMNFPLFLDYRGTVPSFEAQVRSMLPGATLTLERVRYRLVRMLKSNLDFYIPIGGQTMDDRISGRKNRRRASLSSPDTLLTVETDPEGQQP